MAFRPRPVRAVFRGSSCPTQWKLPMASTWTWTSSSMSTILRKAIPSKGSTFSAGSRAHLNSALCPEISVFQGMELGRPQRKRTAHGLGHLPWGPSLNHGWQKSNRYLTSGQVKGELPARAAGRQPVRELAIFQLSPEMRWELGLGMVKRNLSGFKVGRTCCEHQACPSPYNSGKVLIQVVQTVLWEHRRVGRQRTCSVLHQT